MRQLLLPFYQPSVVAAERGVLTVLAAALAVAEQTLLDEHPLINDAPTLDEHHAPIVVSAARLIVGRCAELRSLLDFYDAAVDQIIPPTDYPLPF